MSLPIPAPIVCSRCQEENRRTHKFCTRCGQKLPPPPMEKYTIWMCPECEAVLSKNSYCPEHGYSAVSVERERDAMVMTKPADPYTIGSAPTGAPRIEDSSLMAISVRRCSECNNIVLNPNYNFCWECGGEIVAVEEVVPDIRIDTL